MDLSARIEKIKPFFISFNVLANDDAAYAVVKLPKGWVMPDLATLKENFKVEVAPLESGKCFITEIKNGSECIFDAIDYVVTFNRQLEATKALFDEKKNELRKIFSVEPLERLKNLRFVIDQPKKTSKKAQKPKSVDEIKGEQDEKADEQEEKVEEQPKVEEPTEPDNSLMSLAKSITE